MKKNWEEIANRPTPELQKKEKVTAENEEPHEVEALDLLDKEQCNEKLTAAEKKAEEFQEKYLRAFADLKNAHLRAERDVENAHKYSIEKFAFAILPVIDNLERTMEIKITDNVVLQNIHAGVELTLKSFMDVLQKFDITQLNPINETFDPKKHSAVAVQENATVPPNTVLQVLQKGYLLKDRLLRPAMVIVSK
jgi:molecular chaperone GrpE